MVLIKIKAGHQMDGKGMFLGTHNNLKYYFWRGRGKMDVPFELAIKLYHENPRRIDFVDENIIKDFMSNYNVKKSVVEKSIDFSKLDELSGFGPEVMKDVKSIFYLVSNINSVEGFIKYVSEDGHIPLNNNISKKLKEWLRGEDE